jgi:hypothetical protein
MHTGVQSLERISEYAEKVHAQSLLKNLWWASV